mmetsp:Transcript_98752/g.288062  ORF Transcript_98752/g.288062 Transcript_98752/m.288062 type:complete len:293 (+) Transcript_98752:725-1603(+)
MLQHATEVARGDVVRTHQVLHVQGHPQVRRAPDQGWAPVRPRAQAPPVGRAGAAARRGRGRLRGARAPPAPPGHLPGALRDGRGPGNAGRLGRGLRRDRPAPGQRGKGQGRQGRGARAPGRRRQLVLHHLRLLAALLARHGARSGGGLGLLDLAAGPQLRLRGPGQPAVRLDARAQVAGQGLERHAPRLRPHDRPANGGVPEVFGGGRLPVCQKAWEGRERRALIGLVWQAASLVAGVGEEVWGAHGEEDAKGGKYVAGVGRGRSKGQGCSEEAHTNQVKPWTKQDISSPQL